MRLPLATETVRPSRFFAASRLLKVRGLPTAHLLVISDDATGNGRSICLKSKNFIRRFFYCICLGFSIPALFPALFRPIEPDSFLLLAGSLLRRVTGFLHPRTGHFLHLITDFPGLNPPIRGNDFASDLKLAQASLTRFATVATQEKEFTRLFRMV